MKSTKNNQVCEQTEHFGTQIWFVWQQPNVQLTFAVACAKTALKLATTIGENHIRRHIRLASVTTNRSHLAEVYQWQWTLKRYKTLKMKPTNFIKICISKLPKLGTMNHISFRLLLLRHETICQRICHRHQHFQLSVIDWKHTCFA